MPAINSIDAIQVEVIDLGHILEAASGILREMDRDKIGVAQLGEIDQVMAIVRIARDHAALVSEQIEANYAKLRGAE